VNPYCETVFGGHGFNVLAFPLFKWFFEQRKKPEPKEKREVSKTIIITDRE
jgi:hypothetical protein